MHPGFVLSPASARRAGAQSSFVPSPHNQNVHNTKRLEHGSSDKQAMDHVSMAAGSELTAQFRTTNRSVSSSPHAKRQVACASALMASTPSPGTSTVATPGPKGSLELLGGRTAVQLLTQTPDSPGALAYMTPSMTPASTVLSSQLHNTSSSLSSRGDVQSSLLSLTISRQTVTPVKAYSEDILATQADEENDYSQSALNAALTPHLVMSSSPRRVGNKTCSRASMLETPAVPKPQEYPTSMTTPQVGDKRSRAQFETMDVVETQPSDDVLGSPSIEDIMQRIPRVSRTGVEEYKSSEDDAQWSHGTQADVDVSVPDVNTGAAELPQSAPAAPLGMHSIAFQSPVPFVYDERQDWVHVLRSRWQGRDEIIDCLLPTTATPASWAPNCVTYGAPSCGKSKFWRLANSLVVWVTEVRKLPLSKFLMDLHTGNPASRQLCAAIIQWTTGPINVTCRQACKVARPEYPGQRAIETITIGVKPQRCNNICDFTSALECFCSLSLDVVDLGSTHDMQDFMSIHVILDDADKLLKLDRSMIVQLLNLTRKMQGSLSFKLITASGSSLQATYAGLDLPPVELNFPPPPPLHMFSLVREMCPVGEHVLFNNCVNMVERVFGFYVWSDFRELVYIVKHLYAVYRQAEAAGIPLSKLQSHANPHIVALRARLFHRDTALQTVPDYKTSHGPAITATASTEVKIRSVDMELPYCSKVLLVAAFCASHNPAHTDKRLFSARKTSKGPSQTIKTLGKEKLRSLMAGPKMFTLERLLQLFYGLVAGTAKNGANEWAYISDAELLHKLATLTTLGLLELVSGTAHTDLVKYRCTISEESAINICNTLSKDDSIDLSKYLYDVLT